MKILGLTGLTLAIAGAVVAAQPARADILNSTYTVTVSEGLTSGAFNSTNGNPFAGSNTASATFTYSGPLNFSNTASPVTTASGDLNSTFGFSATNISGYSGSGSVTTSGGTQVANYTSLTAFLGSSGSSAVYQYGSYYTFDLGVVTAGTTLTIRHDDGISLYQGTTRIGNTVTGATGATTDTVTIANTADTILRYTRQNSTPSILQVSVPEPMSLALLGAGLAGLGLVRRKNRAA